MGGGGRGLIQEWPALDYSTFENSEDSIQLHSLLPSCSTPVNISEKERELASDPDRDFVNSILHDLTNGLDIRYKGPYLHRLAKNLLSVHNNPQVVHDYSEKDLAQPCGRTIQTSTIGQLAMLTYWPCTKKDGSWRMIMDLSAPKCSVNDFIPQEQF